MAFIRIALLLSCVAVTAFGMPRYVAIPIEDLERVAIVAQPSVYRQPRSLYDSDVSETGAQEQYVQAPSNLDDDRAKRESAGYGHPSHVDYGAYTGPHGAFGWYTDHPVGGGYH